MQYYACLSFIRVVQEETQQDQNPVLVSQVAAEKLAAATRANDTATESSAKYDTDEGDDAFDHDGGGGECATETGEVKTKETDEAKKPRKKKKAKSDQPVREHLSDTGDMHLLMRRATLFWNCSPSAVDIADAPAHQERLKGALIAVQTTNMQGLRDRAPSIFVGEFMRKNMTEAAGAADKVNTISSYMHPKFCSFPAFPSCLFQCAGNRHVFWTTDEQACGAPCSGGFIYCRS
jgi:hypothetical protein